MSPHRTHLVLRYQPAREIGPCRQAKMCHCLVFVNTVDGHSRVECLAFQIEGVPEWARRYSSLSFFRYRRFQKYWWFYQSRGPCRPDYGQEKQAPKPGDLFESSFPGWQAVLYREMDFKAFTKSRRPAPAWPPFTGAAWEIARITLPTLRNGLTSRSREMAPATCGELKEVPQAMA